MAVNSSVVFFQIVGHPKQSTYIEQFHHMVGREFAMQSIWLCINDHSNPVLDKFLKKALAGAE